MSKDNGGPAFPWDQPPFQPSPGMTLRDYFAAKAMARLMDEWVADRNAFSGSPEIASVAYEYADAMLAERAK